MTESGPTTGDRLDWLFVMPGRPDSGWILEAICREIGSRQPGSWRIVYQLKTLPPARNYFFAHYSTYIHHARHNPQIFDGATLVWYTHPRDIKVSIDDQLAAFDRAHRVVFTCSRNARAWARIGLEPGRSCVVLGGADPALFRPHARGTGVVGLSSAFYERKRPDALLPRLIPTAGRGWPISATRSSRWTNWPPARRGGSCARGRPAPSPRSSATAEPPTARERAACHPPTIRPACVGPSPSWRHSTSAISGSRWRWRSPSGRSR